MTWPAVEPDEDAGLRLRGGDGPEAEQVPHPEAEGGQRADPKDFAAVWYSFHCHRSKGVSHLPK
jgi:hypothetical protein